MSRNIGCTPRLNRLVSERDVSPGVSKLLCIKTTGKHILKKAKMALGNKLIDSALQKAIYPTVLVITFMPRRSNLTDYSKIRNNRIHIYWHREDSNSTCVHQ